MFLVPITEAELLNVTSKLNGNFSAGYNEIPENLIHATVENMTSWFTVSTRSRGVSGH
jgi:hypothetical protein